MGGSDEKKAEDRKCHPETAQELPLSEWEQNLLSGLKAAAREAGRIILEAVRTSDMTDRKAGKANFVTKYDKMVQSFLQKRLLELLPGAVFVGEEEDVHAAIGSGYAFIVDPIDGTTNFIMDYKVSAVSIGLMKDRKRYMGVIYLPYRDEMYEAVAGCGAYMNGAPIHVSESRLEDSLVIMGTATYYKEYGRRTFDLAYRLFERSLDVRRSGSAATDLCSIAAGRAGLYFEYMLSPWDYAAGALILEEAGGVVTAIDGSALVDGTMTGILATNRVIRGEELPWENI